MSPNSLLLDLWLMARNNSKLNRGIGTIQNGKTNRAQITRFNYRTFSFEISGYYSELTVSNTTGLNLKLNGLSFPKTGSLGTYWFWI